MLIELISNILKKIVEERKNLLSIINEFEHDVYFKCQFKISWKFDSGSK